MAGMTQQSGSGFPPLFPPSRRRSTPRLPWERGRLVRRAVRTASHDVVAQTFLSAVSPTFLSAGPCHVPTPQVHPTARMLLNLRRLRVRLRRPHVLSPAAEASVANWTGLSALARYLHRTRADGPGWDIAAPLALIHGPLTSRWICPSSPFGVPVYPKPSAKAGDTPGRMGRSMRPCG